MADSWRIVIASQREPDVAELAAICRDAAHTPVAHMFARPAWVARSIHLRQSGS